MAEFITTGKIAEITGKTQRTILNWLEKGVIPGDKIGGTWLIDEKKFRAAFQKSKEKLWRSTSEANGHGLSLGLTVKQSDDRLKQRLGLRH